MTAKPSQPRPLHLTDEKTGIEVEWSYGTNLHHPTVALVGSAAAYDNKLPEYLAYYSLEAVFGHGDDAEVHHWHHQAKKGAPQLFGAAAASSATRTALKGAAKRTLATLRADHTEWLDRNAARQLWENEQQELKRLERLATRQAAK